MKIAKILLLVIFWLLFFPLFIIMAKHWRMMKLKFSIPISLVSPLGVVLIVFVVLGIQMWRDDYYRTHHFTDNDVIETITGIPLPEFEIVNYTKGIRDITGDFEDNVKIHFKEAIPLSTFTFLDSIIKLHESNWHKREDEYSYNVMWGNGFQAPPGEYDEHDGFFNLKIKKGSKNGTIKHGMW